MREKFSKRHGYHPVEIAVTIRNEAPPKLRGFVQQIIYALGKKPTFLRGVICRLLRLRPDSNNFTDYPNIDTEVEGLIENCKWYEIYDLIEALWDALDGDVKLEFQEEVNLYFKENGIGWKMDFGTIGYRGDETFENTLIVVEAALNKAELPTALTEIKEAIGDLSRRPIADITGAIQHSVACLECVSRETTGDKKATLGQLINKYPDIVPKPLDKAIEKIWGYTSEQGRHLQEGNPPEYIEAELVVSVTAALSTYLAKKMPSSNSSDDTDLPF